MTLQTTKTKLALAFSMTTFLAAGAATAQNKTIVSETFAGNGGALAGSTAEVFESAITTAGGSNSWVSSDTFFDDGGVAPGTSNTAAHLSLGSYINNTKGTEAGVFELTMTIAPISGTGNNWLSIGFAEGNSPATNNHFLNLSGAGTIILRESGELDMWGGPGNTNDIDGPNNNAGARTLTVALDLSTHDGINDFGTVTWSDSALGTINSHSYTSDVGFNSILLSEANGTTTTLSSLTLTQADVEVVEEEEEGEEWDIYLLGGQSNAEGRAVNTNLPASLQGSQSDVMFFNGPGGSWGALRPGTGGNSATGGNSSQFGPEVTFGRTLADDQPDRNIAIVKHGAGGTSLHTDWNPDDTGADNRYDDFLTTVSNAIAALPPGVTFTIKGMLWMQGENDAPATGGNAINPNASAYEANLTNFISTVRTQFGVPEMPFIIGQLGHLRDVPVSNTNWTIVQSGQARVAALDPNVAMVINTDLPLRDLVHYNAEGQQTLGINFAKALQGEVEQVQINGPSFETAEFNNNDDGDQTDNFDSTLISGWMESGTVNNTARSDDTGIFFLDGTFYSDFANLNVDGSNALALSANVSLQQSLSAVLVEGTTYALSVAVGNRDLGAFQDFAGARIEFLSDGQVIADSGDILSSDVADGTFTDFTFSYTAGASDAGGVIGVRLLSLNANSATSSVDFDNLRITATPDFRVTNFSVVGGNAIEITWTSVPGSSYSIEASEDLMNWSEIEPLIEAAIAPASTTTQLIDLPTPQVAKMFYRVRLD